MSPEIAKEIQAEQEHGRNKYGTAPDDFAHDDGHPDYLWHDLIANHNKWGRDATPMDRRQHLVKLAGLAVSAIESFDRKRKRSGL